LTDLIRGNRGTIDKYMGDCVMAFWGAPVDTPDHAGLAVKTALEMSNAVRKSTKNTGTKGLPEIGIGIGLNTGTMCVGDMGSDIRRSYTVIGDAVNLGSRLEGCPKPTVWILWSASPPASWPTTLHGRNWTKFA
jgi:adenylate cyclase